MGLLEDIQGAVAEGFAALGNLAQSVTYRSFSSAPYTASAGTAARTETTVAGVKAVIGGFSAREVAASTRGVPGRDPVEIRLTDRKATIPSKHLPNVTPKVSDRVELADGTVWEVFLVRTDPATAAWVLGLRRP